MIHLTYQERRVLLFLSLLFALGLGLSFFKKTTGCNVCSFNLYSDKTKPRTLDINQATREELIALPGIGEKTADAMIALRSAQGRFKDLDELKKIKGISDNKLERLKDYLQVQ